SDSPLDLRPLERAVHVVPELLAVHLDPAHSLADVVTSLLAHAHAEPAPTVAHVHATIATPALPLRGARFARLHQVADDHRRRSRGGSTSSEAPRMRIARAHPRAQASIGTPSASSGHAVL